MRIRTEEQLKRHREYNKARSKELRAERKVKGLCALCGEQARPGLTLCETCHTKYRGSRKRSNLKRKLRLKIQVFTVYGNKCACCGLSDTRFLQLDHVNNDGNKHKMPSGQKCKGVDLLLWAVNNGFPDVLQLLCANCNWAKGVYGKCPHELDRDSLLSGVDLGVYI